MMRETYPAPFGCVPLLTAPTAIPPITDPLGKHWRQPDMSSVEILSEHALMTQRECDQLFEYSSSTPSALYDGKCWKTRWGDKWYLRWCSPHTLADRININEREIAIIERN